MGVSIYFMIDWIAAHALGVRLGCFTVVLLAMAVWEQLTPRRPRQVARITRWTNHLLLSAINTLIVLLPVTTAGVALYAEVERWGFFNRYPVSPAVAVIASVVALDFVIYLQ